KRNQLKYMLSAFAFAHMGAVLHFGGAYFRAEPFPHDFLLIIFVGLISYAIVQHRLMEISVVFNKGLAFGLLVGVIFVPVYAAILVSHRATAYSIPPLVAASLVFGCGLWIALKIPRNAVNLTFGLLCAGVCTWLFSMFMMFSSAQEAEAVLWGKVAHAGVVFIPAFFYHFCMKFLKRPNGKATVVTSYLISACFLALIPTDHLVSGRYVHSWGIYLKAGALYPVFLGYFGVMTGLSMFALYREIKTKSADAPAEATRIRYVLAAFAIGYLASIDFAQAYGAEFYPIGFVFVGLWISVVMYAI